MFRSALPDRKLLETATKRLAQKTGRSATRRQGINDRRNPPTDRACDESRKSGVQFVVALCGCKEALTAFLEKRPADFTRTRNKPAIAEES
jgi:hypothetical protein